MQIWIDNTQLNDAPDLSAALDLAREHAESAGRLIVDILVDGQPAPDSIFEEDSPDHSSINEMRFTTADIKALIVESAQTAIDSIELLKSDQDAGVEQIRSGEIADSMETMRSIMEGWQAVRDIVDQIAQLAGIDIPSFSVGADTGAQIVQSLSDALSEVRETLQNEDWSSLGDVIEYDLTEQAAKWSSLLSALIQRVESP